MGSRGFSIGIAMNTYWRSLLATESALVAITFLVMGGLHFGLQLGPVRDRPIPIGAEVETVCGVVMAAAAIALAFRASWDRSAAIAAYGFATLAVLLGIFATRNGTTELNFVYHRAVLALLALGLLALLTAPGRALRPSA